MDPDEIEFVGEKEIIGIVPKFSSKHPVHLVSGDFGPFRAGFPLHVPLWLAIHLRKQGKCHIVPPHWMDVDILTEKKEQEKNDRYFTKMPSEHYMVEAKLIFSVAAEDVPHSEEIRTIIKDIYDIRMAKLRTAVDYIVSGEDEYSRLDNLTMMETQSVRPILPHTMDFLDRLKGFKKQKRPTTSSGSSVSASVSHPSTSNLSSTLYL